jgi:hypothetical protein
MADINRGLMTHSRVLLTCSQWSPPKVNLTIAGQEFLPPDMWKELIIIAQCLRTIYLYFVDSNKDLRFQDLQYSGLFFLILSGGCTLDLFLLYFV